MENTPRGQASSAGYSDQLKEPFTGAGLRVEWASHAIGDIAKTHKIKNIHYADINTLSVLSGIFRRSRVIVYGSNAETYQ